MQRPGPSPGCPSEAQHERHLKFINVKEGRKQGQLNIEIQTPPFRLQKQCDVHSPKASIDLSLA